MRLSGKNIGKQLRDPIFIGIVLLQIAAFGVIGADAKGDNLSANRLLADVSDQPIIAGKTLPSFATYDESGKRQGPLMRGRSAVVIFKNDCTCDKDQVANWLEVARRRRQDVTVVVPVAPRKLRETRAVNQLSGRILSIRIDEMMRLGLVEEHLPLELHISPAGTVLAAQAAH